MSGGEPREVQNNTWELRAVTITLDDDGGSITGAAV